MKETPKLRSVLKRGAVITAACWPVLLIQFVAESVFKILLAVPVLAGAFLAATLLGRRAADLAGEDLRATAMAVIGVLLAQPGALAAFVVAVLVVVFGGSALMFVLKGGTIAVLQAGEASSGWLERAGPVSVFKSGSLFSVERFTNGARQFARRYLTLGTVLILAYSIIGTLYLVVVLGGYPPAGNRVMLLGWTIIVTAGSSVLVVAITLTNLFYLLIQIVIAVDNCGTIAAARQVFRFLHADIRDVVGVFLVVLCLVVAATVASLVATAALGFMAFVPIAGLVVLPMQLAAWLMRSLIFQYLGLTALTSYLTLYRRYARGDDRDDRDRLSVSTA